MYKLSCVVFLFLCSQVMAQDKISIHGRVLSNQGYGLPTVRVEVDGMGTSTTTGPCGKFNILATSRSVLHVSIFSHSYYIDLREVKSENFQEEIILKLLAFDIDKEEEIPSISMHCTEPTRVIDIEVSKKHKKKPKS